MRKKITSILKHKRGVTLVELIVTSLVIMIFALGSTRVLSSAIMTYQKIKGAEYSIQIADTVLNKIEGELENAVPASIVSTEDTGTMQIGGSYVDFRNSSGAHVRISLCTDPAHLSIHSGGSEVAREEGRMNIHYYSVSNGKDERYPETDWTFDNKVYMSDFRISQLEFHRPNSTVRPNVIEVQLSLYSPIYGIHKYVRYVECYNFMTRSDMQKIKE